MISLAKKKRFQKLHSIVLSSVIVILMARILIVHFSIAKQQSKMRPYRLEMDPFLPPLHMKVIPGIVIVINKVGIVAKKIV